MKVEKRHIISTGKNSHSSLHINDFDDLVFENRNKEYGAYLLRKKYNSALLTGIIAATLIMISVVFVAFLARPRNERVLTGGRNYVSIRMEKFDPPEEQIYIPPPPAPPPRQKAPEPVQYIPPVVVDSIMPFERSVIATDELLAANDIEDAEITGAGGGGDLLPGMGYGSEEEGEPFYFVEVMPLFRGGDLDKFREWVQKRTNYPQEAIDNKIRGRVFLTFIVEPDGSVSNVTVVKGVAPIIDNEAVKAIEASPKWSPGLQRGKPVRVRFSMWLNFIF